MTCTMACSRDAPGAPRPRAAHRCAAAAVALLLALASASALRAQATVPPAAARPDGPAPHPDSPAAQGPTAARDSPAVADSLGAALLPGATFPQRPIPGIHHVDEAGVIDPADGRRLDALAEALLRDEHVPLLVVTLKDLASHGAAGAPIERYAAALFREWRMGTAERDVGMLLLVSVGDRLARIELGAGWGHAYDETALTVMNTLILPRFREGRYSEGVLAGARGLDAMARARPLPSPPTPWWQWPLTGAIFLGVSGIVYSVVNSGRYGWAYAIASGLVGLVSLLLAVRAEARDERSRT